MAVEADRLADGLRRGAEALPPQPVADHGHRVGARHPIVRGGQQPAACGPGAEQLEEAPADERPGDSLGGAPAAAREVKRLAFVVRRDAGEGRRRVPIVREDGVRGVRELDALDVGRIHPDQGRRVPHRERAEQHRVHDREDGDVGADAEGERQHGGSGEARAAPQHPQRVTQVLSGILMGSPHSVPQGGHRGPTRAARRAGTSARRARRRRAGRPRRRGQPGRRDAPRTGAPRASAIAPSAPRTPAARPAATVADPLDEHEARDVAGRRPEGHADPDLARALSDGVRDDAVEPERRERQRGEGERREQPHDEAPRRRGTGHALAHRGDVVDRDSGIEGANRAADRLGQPRRALGPGEDDEDQASRRSSASGADTSAASGARATSTCRTSPATPTIVRHGP